MNPHAFTLLEALKAGAQAGDEIRLYARGKLPGLFAKRTRHNAEVANQAIEDGLLEVTRVEPIGKATVEWVRVTPHGVNFLLESESPARALAELRDVLAINEQGMPHWLAQMHARLDDLSRRFNDEIGQVRYWLKQIADRTHQALDRIESRQTTPPTEEVPWAQQTLQFLDRRKKVGLGERCPLGDLFLALKDQHRELALRDFHFGLKRLSERECITLLPGINPADAPAPEYALLDGAFVYYYVRLGA
ncbi:MAG: hypothetical protein FJ303_22460 [Planctomycetes bacterium]|nr:hypothetical protein [Planctomycetota bacterium]